MMRKLHVVYYCERMRDGTECGAKLVDSLEQAIEFANKVKNGFCGDNTDIQIFEVDKEIKIEQITEVEKIVTEKPTHKFKVKK